jgi:hypothetical protein
MVDRFRQYSLTRPRVRKFVGWALVVFGFFMLVTPLTPGGSLFFVGLEVLGFRIIGIEKVKNFFRKKRTPTLTLPDAPRAEVV